LEKEGIMSVNHVEGTNKGDVMLYALSTCGWCRKTKELLKELGVGFSYTDVDTLTGDEKQAIVDEVKKWNPSRPLSLMATTVLSDSRKTR
jgi:glutaredoxin-like protein NrdH